MTSGFHVDCRGSRRANLPSSLWWIRDDSVPGTVSVGDLRRAARVDISHGQLSLFGHTEEKMVLTWLSKDPKVIEAARRQLEMAPSVFAHVGNGVFVRYDAVDWIEITRDTDGNEKIVLRAVTVELATVTDPTVIKQIKQFAKL